MDFSLPEFDMRAIGIGFAFWAFCMLVLWKLSSGLGTIPLSTKMMISIFLLPAIYLTVMFQLNR